MKINSKLLLATFFVLGLIIGSNNFAMSDITAKVAVVDVASIVASSNQVKALKSEQAKKAQENLKWLNTVNADIKKQSNDANKQALMKKYDKEYATKRDAQAKEYSKKLAAIDSNISETIAAQAKAKGYTLVLAKSTVLYGGDDITEEIKKVVK